MNRILALSLLLSMNMAAKAQADFCGARNISYREGERLRYKVYYNMGAIWVGAGEVFFTVANETFNGRKAYHLVGDGKTFKSYDWFFKVRDRYESYIDVETMLPLKFIRNVNEGGFRIDNNITFNHAQEQAVTIEGDKKRVHRVPRCVQDVLSAIYYARNIDFDRYAPGAKIPFSMFLDDKVFDLYIRYLGKETIKTRYGTFNTIRFSPLLIEGTMFKGGEKMTVWVTDDANHIPVRVDSPILVGSIKADLLEFNNLRHPLHSLIKKR